MKILSFIPARGGSKGVYKKNIQKLNGHPLIAYTICSSLECDLIHKTIVSSDDNDILDYAKEYGAEVLKRPKHLANDSSPTEPSIQHAVNKIEKSNFKPDFIILNQPTSPFRLVKDLKKAIGLLSSDIDAVMSLSPLPSHYHPKWLKEIRDEHVFSYENNSLVNHPIVETEKYWQRQQLNHDYYWKNGAIYIMSYESIMINGHRYGNNCAPLIIPNDRLVNIDTKMDLDLAKFLIETNRIKLDFNIKRCKYV